MEWDYEPGEILDSGDEEIQSQCNDYTTGRCYIARDVRQTPLQYDQSLGNVHDRIKGGALHVHIHELLCLFIGPAMVVGDDLELRSPG